MAWKCVGRPSFFEGTTASMFWRLGVSKVKVEALLRCQHKSLNTVLSIDKAPSNCKQSYTCLTIGLCCNSALQPV